VNSLETVWQFWLDHGTKVLGALVVVLSQLLTMKAANPEMFGSTMTLYITGTLGVLGAFGIGRGVQNTNAIANKVMEKQDTALLASLPNSVKPPEKTL